MIRPMIAAARITESVARSLPIAVLLGILAERVGFEPTETCASPVFKTGPFNRSGTSPAPRIPSARRGDLRARAAAGRRRVGGPDARATDDPVATGKLGLIEGVV